MPWTFMFIKLKNDEDIKFYHSIRPQCNVGLICFEGKYCEALIYWKLIILENTSHQQGSFYKNDKVEMEVRACRNYK